MPGARLGRGGEGVSAAREQSFHLGHGKVLETDGGDGCAAPGACLVLLNTRKNGPNDTFHVVYNLSQFKEIPPNESKICFRKTKAEKIRCQQAYAVRRVKGNSSDGRK